MNINQINEMFENLPELDAAQLRRDEINANISASRKGMTAPNKGIAHSTEAKAKIGAANKGKVSPFKGKISPYKDVPRTDEVRAAISTACMGKKKGIPQPKRTCSCCGLISSPNVISRFHNDKCKLKS